MTRQGDEEREGGAEAEPRGPRVEWGSGSEPVQDEAGDQAAQVAPEDSPDSVTRYYEQYYTQPYYSWYKPRPKPSAWLRRLRTAAWVSLRVLVACTALGCLALVVLKHSGTLPSSPPVEAGPPLGWRELANWADGSGGILHSGMILYNALIAVDFDGDGDEGVLAPMVFQPGAQRSHPTFYELDGTWQALLAGESEAAPPLVGYLLGIWDHDGDGTPALMLGTPSDEVVVCDLSGNQLGRFSGLPLGYERCPMGDLDGDGVDELLLTDTAGRGTLKALDAQGNVVWRTTSHYGFGATLVGDIDGDGCDELLDSIGYPPVVTILGPQQNPQQVGGLPYGAMPTACVDLNGDGTDEIICANSGYLDMVSGTFTSFGFPGAARSSGGFFGSYGSDDIWGIAAAVGDFAGDSSTEIAVAASRISQPGEPEPDWLYIFDLRGEMIHSEDPGEELYSIVTVRAAGQDHLVALTDTRLLVYP